MVKNNKKRPPQISFSITPDMARALDLMLPVGFDSRASYVRKLLIRDLTEAQMLTGFPRTPAEARARARARAAADARRAA